MLIGACNPMVCPIRVVQGRMTVSAFSEQVSRPDRTRFPFPPVSPMFPLFPPAPPWFPLSPPWFPVFPRVSPGIPHVFPPLPPGFAHRDRPNAGYCTPSYADRHCNPPVHFLAVHFLAVHFLAVHLAAGDATLLLTIVQAVISTGSASAALAGNGAPILPSGCSSSRCVSCGRGHRVPPMWIPRGCVFQLYQACEWMRGSGGHCHQHGSPFAHVPPDCRSYFFLFFFLRLRSTS